LEKLGDFQTLGDPQLERMKTETARFITAFKRDLPPRWLSLVGTCGSGKTMLAKIIKRVCGGRFVTWVHICNMLREGEHRWFQDLCDEPLLYLDDIGGEYQTPFIAAKLYEILSVRVPKWTVLTANLSTEQLGEVDARIASRMIRGASVVVDVDVPDYNLRLK
jgi:DNA replication protein DnaC